MTSRCLRSSLVPGTFDHANYLMGPLVGEWERSTARDRRHGAALYGGATVFLVWLALHVLALSNPRRRSAQPRPRRSGRSVRRENPRRVLVGSVAQTLMATVTVPLMSGVPYGSVDAFGVPGRTLSLSDEFYGALGRVAALGALVELRLSDVVTLWGKNPKDTGQFMQHLTDRFKEIKTSRIKAGQVVPDGLVRAVSAAKAVMKERNELLHSLWPGENIGWRNRPGGSVPTKYVGLPSVRKVVGRLVKAVDGLGPYLYSPID